MLFNCSVKVSFERYVFLVWDFVIVEDKNKIVVELQERIKELEEENRKLKQMYATLALDHQMAKEIIEKKL